MLINNNVLMFLSHLEPTSFYFFFSFFGTEGRHSAYHLSHSLNVVGIINLNYTCVKIPDKLGGLVMGASGTLVTALQ